MLKQLRDDVKKLTDPGTRNVGSLGHEIALNFLADRMYASGLLPYSGESFSLPYRSGTSNYVNLAGVLPGRDRTLDPILLIAHYDTCGDQPGADDNAAAIALWLGVLESSKSYVLQRDVILLFPDAEEPPRFLSEQMGSVNFYEHQLNHKIHAGLVLDLVGHDVPLHGMEDMLFMFGAESQPALAQLLLDTHTPEGLRNIATLNRYVGDLSDHHILRKNKEAYLFLTCGRWEHYHQKSDTPEHLNYDKMEKIGQYLLSLIRGLDIIEFDRNVEKTDPVDMELRLFKRAIGSYLEQENIAMNNRDDIQRFVLSLVNQHQL